MNLYLLQNCLGAGCNAGLRSSTPDSCSDTDGGYVVEKKGTVSGYLNGNFYQETDYCSDSVTLMEKVCVGNCQTNSTYSCLGNYASCSNGACI